MKRIIKEYWPLLLIAGWLLWRKYGKKKPAQTPEKIQTREDAINYLKENFIGISGVVGWSHRDLDPDGGPYAMDESDFVPGLSICGKEYVAANTETPLWRLSGFCSETIRSKPFTIHRL